MPKYKEDLTPQKRTNSVKNKMTSHKNEYDQTHNMKTTSPKILIRPDKKIR